MFYCSGVGKGLFGISDIVRFGFVKSISGLTIYPRGKGPTPELFYGLGNIASPSSNEHGSFATSTMNVNLFQLQHRTFIHKFVRTHDERRQTGEVSGGCQRLG